MPIDDLFAYLCIAALFVVGSVLWYVQRQSRIETDKWTKQLKELAKSKANSLNKPNDLGK